MTVWGITRSGNERDGSQFAVFEAVPRPETLLAGFGDLPRRADWIDGSFRVFQMAWESVGWSGRRGRQHQGEPGGQRRNSDAEAAGGDGEQRRRSHEVAAQRRGKAEAAGAADEGGEGSAI